MPEKKTLNEDLFYKGSSANLPRLHTCKNEVLFWDFEEFAVTLCITNNSIKYQSFVYSRLKDPAILLPTIQFNINPLFAHRLNVKQSYLIIDRTLSHATTLDKSGPGSNGNEGVLHIPQWKTGASASDCLV